MLTPYAVNRYAPRDVRAGVALCLSGGGFRAALFHLGALRRLNELDVLRNIDTIRSVSGGSTIAAWLAYNHHHWHQGPCAPDVWDREISAPFRTFTSRNLSTPAVLTQFWHWRSNFAIEAFGRACDPLCPMTLGQLPPRPNFQFCATELVGGKQYAFERGGPESGWRVGQAVAISSALPLIFLRPFRDAAQDRIMVDGGVGDNRGIEPVWQTHDTLLVSDGGEVLRAHWSPWFFYGLLRSSQVLLASMQEVQKRWLIGLLSGQLRGAYWSTGSVPAHYRHDPAVPPYGYSESLVRDVIATIRTKYDVFTPDEAAVLENHGYILADIAIRTHASGLVGVNAALHIPHPASMSDAKMREALRESSSSPVMGHGWLPACLRSICGIREPLVPLPAPHSVDVNPSSLPT